MSGFEAGTEGFLRAGYHVPAVLSLRLAGSSYLTPLSEEAMPKSFVLSVAHYEWDSTASVPGESPGTLAVLQVQT